MKFLKNFDSFEDFTEISGRFFKPSQHKLLEEFLEELRKEYLKDFRFPKIIVDFFSEGSLEGVHRKIHGGISIEKVDFLQELLVEFLVEFLKESLKSLLLKS